MSTHENKKKEVVRVNQKSDKLDTSKTNKVGVGEGVSLAWRVQKKEEEKEVKEKEREKNSVYQYRVVYQYKSARG